jgi:cysteine desulfurase
MAANNETGIVQPFAEAARLVHEFGGLFLCDAAQAFGRLPSSDLSFGADYLVVSSHKIGGPPGAGALVVGCDAPFAAPRRGGGQERGRRAGTENTPAIAGFGAATRVASRMQEAESARLATLRDGFEKKLRASVPGVELIGTEAPRLSNTSVFALPGLKAETAVIAFDLAGVCVSAGAACSSGKVRRSRVLEAMGVDPAIADGAVRASFGWASTEGDIDALIEAAARIGAKSRAREMAQ